MRIQLPYISSLLIINILLLLFAFCPLAKAQLVPGKDIIYVKKSDGEKLLARITAVTSDEVDVVSLNGKTYKTFKLSELTKIEWISKKKLKGFSYPVDFYRFYKGGSIGAWGIVKNGTFQIVYGNEKKWNTSTGASRLIALASESYSPPSRPGNEKSKTKPKKQEKEIPRRLRRGVTRQSQIDSQNDISDRKRKRGVTWTRPSNTAKDVGTSLAEAGAICYNSVVDGKMLSKDYDTYRFFFPGGNFVCYSLGNLDLVADLVNEKGKQIARSYNHDSTQNFRFEQSLKPGVYYVKIRVMRHAGTGPYYLILGNGRKQFKEESIQIQTKTRDEF